MSVEVVEDARALMRSQGVGDTPLVRLQGISARGSVWLKAEYANPFGSVKDRTAAFLLSWARRAVGPEVGVVESTSGNLGLALAHLGAELGNLVTLVMDASLPRQRVEDVRRAGATVHVVEACRPGMTFRETRIAIAQELGGQPGSIWLNQYANEAGVRAHRHTTGPEIWDTVGGQVDVVVASVGTGGTICGIATSWGDRLKAPTIVGVEPMGSTIFGGLDGDYLPAGSGMRGQPEIVARYPTMVNLVAKVPDAISASWTLHLLTQYGLEVGLTTGAATAVAVRLATERDARVVAIAPDHGLAFRSATRTIARQAPPISDPSAIRIGRPGSLEMAP